MKDRERGVVLLIAILFSAVALAVGVGVYTRTYKELLLSSFWKQSQIAFAAADAGLECALYWETHPGGGSATCFGNSPITTWVPGNPLGGSFQETVYGGCARVTIVKAPSPSLPLGIVMRIESRGQSDSCGAINNLRRVERGLKLEY